MLLWKIGQQKKQHGSARCRETDTVKLLLSLDGIWGLDSIWLSGASLGLQPQPFTATYASLWGTLCERRSIPPPLMTQCRGSIMMQQYVLWFILILHDHCSMRLLLLMNNRRKDWLISCGCLLLFFFLYLDGETKSISSLLMLKLISSSLRQPGCTIVNRLFRGWDRGAINGLYCHISENFTSGTSSHPECNMCLYTCAF